MSGLQKLFLLLIVGYLAVKGVFALLLHTVTRQVERKGLEFHQKRNALREDCINRNGSG
ncbi:MAG: hypothetical protein GXY92_02275 [Syntrophomonadaceae bacterium]|nr:hypothetical protein [Syntrophomonadaceae bacterium]